MDKETLIKLAQPAATLALAISVISYPLIVNAYSQSYPTVSGSISVYHENSCAD